MTIQLNGEPRQTAAASVLALLEELELAPQAVLVEHNGTALHRSELTDTALQEGDRLEILRVVAGG